MFRRQPAPEEPLQDAGVAVDHVGIVVADLAAEVEAWRREGFDVSDPVALLGQDAQGRPRPLGQASAHVVFENGYVELSSPDVGSGNHLEPYLALGEGIRILVVAVADAAKARSVLLADDPSVAPVRVAARDVALGGATERAAFHWFPLARDIVPGVLSAVVEHRSRALVLHPILCRHANGLRRIEAVVAEGREADIVALPAAVGGLEGAPPLLLSPSHQPARLTGLLLSGGERGRCFFRVSP